MGATSSLREPIFTLADMLSLFDHQDVNSPSQPKWSHEDFFPCSFEQFEMICRITTLHKSQQGPGGLKSFPRSMLMRMWHTVENWRPQHHRGADYFHFTEAFRHGILIYGLRLLQPSADILEMDALVESIIFHTNQISPPSPLVYHLIWPLFQAGLQTVEEEKKTWFRRKFMPMTLQLGFQVCASTLARLEEVWSSQLSGSRVKHPGGEGKGDLLVA